MRYCRPVVGVHDLTDLPGKYLAQIVVEVFMDLELSDVHRILMLFGGH
jgi:hypothetical protein